MWQWIAVIVLIVAAAFFLPWAVGSMRKDQRKRGGGGMGTALLEAQAFVAPSTKHLIEARQEKVVEAAGDSDPEDPDQPKP